MSGDDFSAENQDLKVFEVDWSKPFGIDPEGSPENQIYRRRTEGKGKLLLFMGFITPEQVGATIPDDANFGRRKALAEPIDPPVEEYREAYRLIVEARALKALRKETE